MNSHSLSESTPLSSPFEMIYQAAKEKNTQALTQILLSTIIDVFDKNYDSSPIARLATENDIESVNFLANHNASLDWAAYGFARGGHLSEAINLLENTKRKHPDQVNDILCGIASGLAIGGYRSQALAFLNKIKSEYPEQIASIINYMADSFAKRTQKQEAYAFLDDIRNTYPAYTIAVLKEMARSEKQAGTSIDHAVVLKTLTLIQEEKVRSQLAHDLKASVSDYNSLHVLKKANRFNTAMRINQLTYNQVVGWFQPEMQLFLLQGISLVHQNKLTTSIFLHIATFLAPMHPAEMLDLGNKFAMHTRPIRLFTHLRQHGTLLLAYKPVTIDQLEADESKDKKLSNLSQNNR